MTTLKLTQLQKNLAHEFYRFYQCSLMVRRQIVCHMTTEWRSHEVKQAAESHDNYFPIDRAIRIPWSNLFSDQSWLPPSKSISKSNNLQQSAIVSSKIRSNLICILLLRYVRTAKVWKLLWAKLWNYVYPL